MEDQYPSGSHVDVWWCGDKQWFLAKVTDTRTSVRTIKGEKVIVLEIHCRYLLDEVEQWHAMHNTTVRFTSKSTGESVCDTPSHSYD